MKFSSTLHCCNFVATGMNFENCLNICYISLFIFSVTIFFLTIFFTTLFPWPARIAKEVFNFSCVQLQLENKVNKNDNLDDNSLSWLLVQRFRALQLAINETKQVLQFCHIL